METSLDQNKILNLGPEILSSDNASRPEYSYIALTEDTQRKEQESKKIAGNRIFFYKCLLWLLILYNAVKLFYNFNFSFNKEEKRYSMVILIWTSVELIVICGTLFFLAKRDPVKIIGMNIIFLGLAFVNLIAFGLLVCCVYIMTTIAEKIVPIDSNETTAHLYKDLIDSLSQFLIVMFFGDFLLPVIVFLVGRKINLQMDKKSQDETRHKTVISSTGL